MVAVFVVIVGCFCSLLLPSATDTVTGHIRGCAREQACPKLESMWTRKYGFLVLVRCCCVGFFLLNT